MFWKNKHKLTATAAAQFIVNNHGCASVSKLIDRRSCSFRCFLFYLWQHLGKLSCKPLALVSTWSSLRDLSNLDTMNKDECKLLDTTCTIQHLHGLRNRLYITFTELSKILKEALEPPVLKSSKKILIKIEEYDQTVDYILDMKKLITDIKNEYKNECISKNNKANVGFRKRFMMKLNQSYKLAIKTVKVCSSTLRARISHPIQRQMINMIQLISTLSFTSGKFMYGELFKEKRKESFDLVQNCKELKRVLNDFGYNDTENNKHRNVLDELATKALTKNKLFSTNTQYSMYESLKPKLGTHYAQSWSKKISKVAENKVAEERDIKDDFSYGDEIKTAVGDFCLEESSVNNRNSEICCTETKNNNIIDGTFKQTNLPSSSEIVTSYKLNTGSNNVGMYVINENMLCDFPVKDAKVSKDGKVFINTSPDDINKIYDYKIQLKVNDKSEKPAELTKENYYISIKEFLISKARAINLPEPKKKIDVSPEEMKEICERAAKL